MSQHADSADDLARSARLDAVESRARLFMIEQGDPEGDEANAWRTAAEHFDAAAAALRKVGSRG